MSAPHEVFLNPGEFFFGGGYTQVHTILGSCVSITLWHPQKHIGGMCHIMLPGSSRKTTPAFDGRYADEAMRLFDRAIGKAGTHPGDYVAKVFGGGNMFPEQMLAPTADAQKIIGNQNIASALKHLKERKIRIAAQHLGGEGHRKLFFNLWNGDVWLAFRQAGKLIQNGNAP